MKLTIEKMIYGGDGLGRLAPADAPESGGQPATLRTQGRSSLAVPARESAPPSHGKAVFVPFVLQGESVEIEIVENRPGFARGQTLSLLSPSPQRVEPECPYFGRCGGCQYQHASYEHQLAIKQQVLCETLRRTAKIELASPPQVHVSPPWHYRNRTRLKVQSETGASEEGASLRSGFRLRAPSSCELRSPAQPGAAGPTLNHIDSSKLSLGPHGFALGYFAHASHQFVPVEQCPISSPLINRALRALLEVAEFRPWAGEVAEVELFANHDDTALVAGFYTRTRIEAAKFCACFQALQEAVPELRGIALMHGTAGEDDTASARRPAAQILGERWLEYATGEGPFLAGTENFFQTNRFLVDELVSTVLGGSQGRRALDLYAGVGLFSLPLSKRFERVTAVEIAPPAVDALRANIRGAVEVVAVSADQFLRQAERLGDLDLVVLDPPRGGLGEKTARALAALPMPRLTYVSCDPATLARDLRPLLEAGFRIEQAHLLDLFPQTFHLETVLHLAR